MKIAAAPPVNTRMVVKKYELKISGRFKESAVVLTLKIALITPPKSPNSITPVIVGNVCSSLISFGNEISGTGKAYVI